MLRSKRQRLLALWRTQGLPVFHIPHCSTNPASKLAEGDPGNELKEEVKPLSSEPIIKKNVNSAFIGTDLQKQLGEKGVKSLVIVGLTTDHCVSTTARMAGNLGFVTFLVDDATATFDKKSFDGEFFPAALIHQTAQASIQNASATIVRTADVVAAVKALERERREL